MKFAQNALAALALTACATTQQTQSFKTQLIGTWDFVVAAMCRGSLPTIA